MKRYISITLAAVLAMLLSSALGACMPCADYISDSFFAMDTVIEIKLAADTKDSNTLFAECREITEKYDNMSLGDRTVQHVRIGLHGELRTRRAF